MQPLILMSVPESFDAVLMHVYVIAMSKHCTVPYFTITCETSFKETTKVTAKTFNFQELLHISH